VIAPLVAWIRDAPAKVGLGAAPQALPRKLAGPALPERTQAPGARLRSAALAAIEEDQ
jgi:hypothetical protein